MLDANERNELERKIGVMNRLASELHEIREPLSTAVEKIAEEVRAARSHNGSFWDVERWSIGPDVVELTYRYGGESSDTDEMQFTRKLFLDYFTDRPAYAEEIERLRTERLAQEAKSREADAARTLADKRRDLERLKKELGEK